MTIHATLRTLALAVAGFCASTAGAQVFVDQPGPNNLDLIADGEAIYVGLDANFAPVPGVQALNTVGKSFNSLYAWSDSVTELNNAFFSGLELLAFENSVVNYAGGNNPEINAITFDDATINFTGGTIGSLGTGGGLGFGGTAYINGGTILEVVGCTGGKIYVTGGTFNPPTLAPFSFYSEVPAGIAFSGTGIVATLIDGDPGNPYGGNYWLLTGTLVNGGSVDGVFIVDAGIFDPTVIVNYSGVAIAGADQPPVADAGIDFSVNEVSAVMLDGSLSSDPDGDTLTYSWTQLAGGPSVMLSGNDTATPSFTSPEVALGGETLTFQLTVTANGQSASDTVSVTVVNINHTPVALAGTDQNVTEGTFVTLDGSDSFDVDGDAITYSWTQVDGIPIVMLSGADTAMPTFSAPWVGSGGAAFTFELRVDDGFSPDAPAPGFELGDVVSTVTVFVTNMNTAPNACAGPNACVNENSVATLNGNGSSDPDGDPLAFSWIQISGPSVTLTDATTATPTFTAPSVNSCGTTLKFRLNVYDGYGGSDYDDVCIFVKNVGQPPNVSDAYPSDGILWPPNHRLECIQVKGVTGGNNMTLQITGVTQDEPTNGLGDGDTAIDAVIKSNGKVLLRAERQGGGNGRVYRVYFTATNAAGSSSGMVKVGVPHSKKSTPVDSGSVFNSTQ